MEEVILVDEHGRDIGYAEKLAAHRDGGRLHRAFSIFIFNDSGELLLQRRAAGKYHFAGLWSNACCSHPRRGETLAQATRRRLREELGFDTELQEVAAVMYEAADPASDLTEREYDHVFVGCYDGPVQPQPDEIEELRWISPAALRLEIARHPERFTPWFKLILPRVLEAAASAGRVRSGGHGGGHGCGER